MSNDFEPKEYPIISNLFEILEYPFTDDDDEFSSEDEQQVLEEIFGSNFMKEMELEKLEKMYE